MKKQVIDRIATTLADGSVAVVSSWTNAEGEEQIERNIYRDEGEYKHFLRLMRQMGDARQGLLK